MNTTNRVVAPLDSAGEPTEASSGRAIAQAMLDEFERELGTTRRFLERVPADRLMWRPHEKSITAGQLAMGIALWVERKQRSAITADRDRRALQYERLDSAMRNNLGWEQQWNEARDNVPLHRRR